MDEVKKAKQDAANKAKKLRIEQLLGMGREELIGYGSKLGFKNLKWKVVDEKKRETKDVAHLIYYKELELGGRDKAAEIIMAEIARREALVKQKKEKERRKSNSENATIRDLQKRLAELESKIK